MSAVVVSVERSYSSVGEVWSHSPLAFLTRLHLSRRPLEGVHLLEDMSGIRTVGLWEGPFGLRMRVVGEQGASADACTRRVAVAPRELAAPWRHWGFMHCDGRLLHRPIGVSVSPTAAYCVQCVWAELDQLWTIFLSKSVGDALSQSIIFVRCSRLCSPLCLSCLMFFLLTSVPALLLPHPFRQLFVWS